MRQNWIALAVACHLGRNFDQADKVLTSYVATLKNVPDYDFEYSEVLLYHVRVLEESGKHEAALTKLDAHSKSREIVDRVAIGETRARLLAKLGRTEEALDAYNALVDRNPGRVEYIKDLAKLKGVDIDALTDETVPLALEVLDELEKRVPKGSAPTRLALSAAQGDEFAARARRYIESGLKRGVPSLFADIKPLYADDAKRKAVESIVASFHDAVAPTASPPGEPSTYLWTLYFLAQHHSKLGDQSRALELLDVALTHTPTLPELYTLRARVLRRAGAPHEAAMSADRARLLDGQDRFLNGKAAKYFFNAGRIQDAENRLGMFTKKDAPSPGADLEDLQSTAYLLQAGAAFEREGKLGHALRKFIGIVKVFEDVEDDQYDFHGYVLRRFTVNVYSDFIAYEDRVRQHPAYIAAALAASRIYLRLHDEPGLATKLVAPPAESEAEKKARKKAKKDAAKEKKDSTKAGGEEEETQQQPSKYDDPEGAKLLATATPLDEAAKILRPLEKLVDRADVWAVFYDVAVRRQKYLQAVKALNRLARLDKEDPLLHVRLLDLRKRVSGTEVSDVVRTSLAALFPQDVASEVFTSQYLQRHSSSPRAVTAVARAASSLTEAEELLFGLFKPEVSLDIKTAREALALLTERKSTRRDEFAAACDDRFVLSTVFKSVEEQRRLVKLDEAAMEDLPATDEVAEK
ncbi:N-terminal acetyltransferase A, auxiliary subunit [Exidia glandulosa HHB12029]|uniref:N-terminal acetyltransferase A, auxiliary subunit n=1 Tax=Exidia glandulosa HHB12029 TaxID=1314781 RepID=A0A165M331_EXIGL|nr:N-terminal acetyltransferase A, auxiliary subunit [Exidia glandulosa HHB12029]